MKTIKYLLISMQAIAILYTYGQSTFIDSNPRDPAAIVHSWEGYRLPTEGVHRMLIIYVNLIYDVQGVNDPIGNNAIWPQTQIEGINVDPSSWPSYINEYISVDYPDSGPLKTFTRLFAESSFNNLIVLGDYLVVNIKHSTISGGDTITESQLIDSVITFINLNGGLQTLHGHDSLLHYQSIPNVEKFYHVMMILRNTTTKYGGVGKGNGKAWGGPGYTGTIINLYTADDDYFDTYTISYQCVGDQDISMNPTLICTHEFSHFLFGHNNFHTSGGHSWGEVMGFPGIQYGYGLMGGASSGLVNCNGYERYRVGWMHEDNKEGWPITALDASSLNRKISDITKAEGNQSFKLDNFITSGDVIRIKLPYIESPASNQYIWLENHKILESTLNFLQYSNTDPICRPQAQKGIYAYYQVGRDILYGPDSLVYSAKYDTDNLRMICANGFYDQDREGVASSTQCPGDKMHFRDIRPNALAGNNDLSSYYFDYEGYDELIPGIHGGMAEAKTYFNSNEPNVKLPFLMSEINPFHGHSVMSMNTNPAPFNSLTYYHAPKRVEGIVYTEPKDAFRNQPDVILTGLKIEMTPLANDDYQIDISWDNYDLDSEVRWTGSIVLKEYLYLTAGSMLLLVQNLTPNTIYRNETTGLFAAPTIFRCDNGSQMFQQEGSELVVDNLSTLLIDDGSEFYALGGTLEVKNDAYLQIASGGYFEQNQDAVIFADDKGIVYIEQGGFYLLDGGTLTIKSGGKLEIEGCATLKIKNGGLLVVEEDAVICVHPGAILDFESTNNYSFEPGFSTGDCIGFTAQNFLEKVLATPPTTSITGTVVWDDVIYNFHDDLHIEPGAHLTVEGGSILRFGLDKRIKVKSGATCIIDGSVFTSLCNDTVWQGIEVYGDKTKSQYHDAMGTMFQGKLIVRNGSLIENACIAALAGMTGSAHEPDDSSFGIPDPPIVYGSTGGIIMAMSSTFKNNQTGIYLPEYENYHHSDPQTPRNNLSYIRNCDFFWDDGLYTGLEAEAFVKLIEVRGINIGGSHFLQQSSQSSAGTGIISLNTSFTVEKACADYQTPCTNFRLSRFENLEYGLQVLGTNTAKTFTVDSSMFRNNIQSVFSNGYDNFRIIRNTFDLSVGFSSDGEDNPIRKEFVGVYIEDDASGFHIEENLFIGSYKMNSEGSRSTVGVAFNNIGPYNNELYNNRFDSLHYASWAMNQNRPERSNGGLCIKCNHYLMNGYDVIVTYDDQLYSWGGIAMRQGSNDILPNAPAGNRFSWNNIDGRPRDINNQGEHIYYYHHIYPSEKLRPEYVDTLKVTRVPNQFAVWDPELSCPSNLTPPGSGHDEEALQGMLVEAGQQADSTQNLINMLKDAGNTQALHWDVSMSAPWQGMEVYSELMSVSPYVSDTVLAAAIEKENVLVNAMIRDVLVANPHSAKSEALMDKLDQRFQPLPGYMLDEILQGHGLVSLFENLQSSLSHHLQKQALYQKQLMQLYLNDTINPAAAADSLVSLLQTSGHPAHWYRAAFLRHEHGNASATASILNNIPTSLNLSTEQLQSHSQLASWLEQENLLRSQEKSLVIPDSASVVWLFDIMENGDLPVSIYARNILLTHALVEHQPRYLLPDDTKSIKVKQQHSQSPPKVEALKLFPNPAREYVIIDFDLAEIQSMEGTGMLKVIALDGKLIESMPLAKTKYQIILPLKDYKPGTYVFTLYFGNKILESKRLIIQ